MEAVSASFVEGLAKLMEKIARYVMEAENAEDVKGKRKNLFTCSKNEEYKAPLFLLDLTQEV